ncbi:MAG: META domain-containing protein [Anaerolineales bacterium]|nr:META domain-containing protein [Anaerolineales bacterium]
MKKIIPIIVALAISLAACGTSPTFPEGEWNLLAYGDVQNPTPALPDVEAVIQFDKGQMNGNVGCNLLGAGYKVEGNAVTFESAFSTRKYCEGMMNQEDAVLKILSEQTLNFEVNGAQLTLTSPDGSSVIVLEKK